MLVLALITRMRYYPLIIHLGKKLHYTPASIGDAGLEDSTMNCELIQIIPVQISHLDMIILFPAFMKICA